MTFLSSTARTGLLGLLDSIAKQTPFLSAFWADIVFASFFEHLHLHLICYNICLRTIDRYQVGKIKNTCSLSPSLNVPISSLSICLYAAPSEWARTFAWPMRRNHKFWSHESSLSKNRRSPPVPFSLDDKQSLLLLGILLCPNLPQNRFFVWDYILPPLWTCFFKISYLCFIVS